MHNVLEYQDGPISPVIGCGVAFILLRARGRTLRADRVSTAPRRPCTPLLVVPQTFLRPHPTPPHPVRHYPPHPPTLHPAPTPPPPPTTTPIPPLHDAPRATPHSWIAGTPAHARACAGVGRWPWRYLVVERWIPLQRDVTLVGVEPGVGHDHYSVFRGVLPALLPHAATFHYTLCPHPYLGCACADTRRGSLRIELVWVLPPPPLVLSNCAVCHSAMGNDVKWNE